MIDFSKLSSHSWIGKLIRLPLCLIPRNTVIPVLQGPLRGLRWIVGAGNHGCWLGTYERHQAIAFAKYSKPGLIIFDIGAHSGYYSLLAARCVGTSGRVFAFEPLPANQEYLNRHLVLNHFKQVTLIKAAVAHHTCTSLFEQGPNRYEGRLTNGSGIEVQVLGLDEEIESGWLPEPDIIKIDVEGAEVEVLAGAQQMLSRRHPLLFVSVHSLENKFKCEGLLSEMGYRIKPISESQSSFELDFISEF